METYFNPDGQLRSKGNLFDFEHMIFFLKLKLVRNLSLSPYCACLLMNGLEFYIRQLYVNKREIFDNLDHLMHLLKVKSQIKMTTTFVHWCIEWSTLLKYILVVLFINISLYQIVELFVYQRKKIFFIKVTIYLSSE